MGASAVLARDACSGGGEHGELARIQRSRVIGATIELVAERGVGGLSVAHIVERSGVSRRTFYDLFEDRRECVAAAFEDALAEVEREVSRACAGESGWRERIRAGVAASLSIFAREPAVARFLVLEAPACGGEVLARRGRVLAQLAVVVDEGRAESRGGGSLPPLTAEGIVGGALAILARALLERGSLLELVNPLMATIVLPYLGAAAARRELAQPLPAAAISRGPAVHVPVDPFKAAGMRLTYRTVRVLLAVAELGEAAGGASNRAVGSMAGISDQGQISKLLGRLQRIGLIENSGLGPGQGAPNAWSLTQAGRELTDRIREHTTSFQ